MQTQTIKDEDYLTNDLGLTSLGIVNEISQKDIDRQVREQASGSEHADNMRRRV